MQNASFSLISLRFSLLAALAIGLAAGPAAGDEEKMGEHQAAGAAAAMKNKGIGPVKSVKIGPIQKELAEKGEKLFEEKCTACHKVGERYVGPAIAGVTKRRTPEWIMNMMLNPDGMVKEDPIAKELLAQHNVAMTFQNITQDDSRAILEYFRTIDASAPAAGGATQPTTTKKKKLPGT